MFEPIYIQRLMTPAGTKMLQDYAYSIGISEPTIDMHATLAYSEDPVDWDKAAFQMDPRPLTVSGGDRALTRFSDDSVVLEFQSAGFSQRWAQFILAGASWNHPEYRPHITLGVDPKIDLSGAIPLQADLPFEAETREWLLSDKAFTGAQEKGTTE